MINQRIERRNANFFSGCLQADSSYIAVYILAYNFQKQLLEDDNHQNVVPNDSKTLNPIIDQSLGRWVHFYRYKSVVYNQGYNYGCL